MTPGPGGGAAATRRAEPTRAALVAAAIEVLRTEGYQRATARRVAAVAGCNQGLVFYHYGSVDDLLLAALDEVSARRRARYDDQIARVTRPSELVELAASIFAEDIASGDAAVLVEMVSAAASVPGLGARVAERVTPWTQFATGALTSTFRATPLLDLAGTDELAYALVALYLGLELLSHLDGDTAPALAVFDRARALSGVADLLAAAARPASDAPDTTQEAP